MFFDEIAATLKFPDYFGHNLDALDECLSDLEWLRENGWVLVFLNADNLLNEEKDSESRKLVKLLDNIGVEWSQNRFNGINTINRRPFHSIFHAIPSNEQILLERFAELQGSDRIQKL